MRHRVGAEPARPSSGKRAALLVALAVVAAGCIAALIALATNQSEITESSPAVTAPPPDEVLAWMRANLSKDTRILTDGSVSPAGFPGAASTATSESWKNFDYFITADTNPAPPSDSPNAGVWRSSTPAAIFQSLQVRRILAGSPTDIQQDREADRADRLQAGSALLGNPAIQTNPGAKAALAGGRLDMRAANALAALASRIGFSIDDVKLIDAESAAGLPARSLTIRVTDTAEAAKVLSGLTAALRPDEVGAGEDGVLRLQWPLSVTPVPVMK